MGAYFPAVLFPCFVVQACNARKSLCISFVRLKKTAHILSYVLLMKLVCIFNSSSPYAYCGNLLCSGSENFKYLRLHGTVKTTCKIQCEWFLWQPWSKALFFMRFSFNFHLEITLLLWAIIFNSQYSIINKKYELTSQEKQLTATYQVENLTYYLWDCVNKHCFANISAFFSFYVT